MNKITYLNLVRLNDSSIVAKSNYPYKSSESGYLYDNYTYMMCNAINNTLIPINIVPIAFILEDDYSYLRYIMKYKSKYIQELFFDDVKVMFIFFYYKCNVKEKDCIISALSDCENKKIKYIIATISYLFLLSNNIFN